MKSEQYHPWLHRIALLTACATFPLIFMGGLVTSHQAGMSVPDWPNSYGYNMFLFPPRLWIGGILYEHTHRLMGTVVGMLSIILAVIAWRVEDRKWARNLAVAVLGAVIFQGVLGGLRVVLVKLNLAILHACVAQAFFCLAALVAIITSKWWLSVHRSSFTIQHSLLILSFATFSLLYLQLIAGALMRHHEAGLAIPDVPLAYGKLLPPANDSQLEQINQLRTWQLNLPRVTLPQIWFHFAHRIGALLVSTAGLALTGTILFRHRNTALFRPALLLLVLLAGQVTLGIFTVLKRKPADVASAHVAIGALCLVTTFVIAVRAFRMYARAAVSVGSASADPIRATSKNPSAEADPTRAYPRPQIA